MALSAGFRAFYGMHNLYLNWRARKMKTGPYRFLAVALWVTGVIGCGGSTAPDPNKHFFANSWNGHAMGVGVITFDNYIKIDSATIDLNADGTVTENLYYDFAVPKTATVSTAHDYSAGHWSTVNGNYEVRLRLGASAGESMVGGDPVNSGTLHLFRSWVRGAEFGGNFIYFLR